MRTLYICYFGLREPLVQTQVLPYLRQMHAAGIDTTLLTFEPTRPAWRPQERGEWGDRLQNDGIRWFCLPYHKHPTLPATVFDIVAGAVTAWRLVRRYGIHVLHARGHVPAAMAALVRKFQPVRVVFDIRGFMPEEYVDAGLWRAGGLLYRLTKAVEKRLFAAADGFVVLTERARSVLFPAWSVDDARGRPVEVIPCCVDLDRFREEPGNPIRRELGLDGRKVLVYVGALGGWYLNREMEDFLAVAHQSDGATFSLIVTQSSEQGAALARRLQERGIKKGDYLIRGVAPGEVPRYLQAANLAFCFIKPGYSKLSSSPTKIAEYLASGLPVICNAGIGDVDEVLQTERVGVLVRDFSSESYVGALRQAEDLLAEPDLRQRCRAAARKRFDLESIGGARYCRLYRRLQQNNQDS